MLIQNLRKMYDVLKIPTFLAILDKIKRVMTSYASSAEKYPNCPSYSSAVTTALDLCLLVLLLFCIRKF